MVSTGASSQEATPLDGTWRMTISYPGAKNPTFGSVELHGDTGTWMIFSRTAVQMFENPCIGRPFTLTIEESQPEAVLTFRVNEADVVHGCVDLNVAFVPVGPRKLEGRIVFGGVPVVLERD